MCGGSSQIPRESGGFLAVTNYTPYAVEFRYAGVDPGAELIDHEGALALVQELLESVEHQLAEVEGQ